MFDTYKQRIQNLSFFLSLCFSSFPSFFFPLSLSSFFLLEINFENITIGLHVLYVLNACVKFCSNRMLFTIQSIKLFFMHNLKHKNLKFK